MLELPELPPELPPEEPPDDPPAGAAGAAGLLSLVLDDEPLLGELSLLLPPPFDDEYKSAYQPPPFRMNVPPLSWRFAVFSPHFGHTWTGASVIF